MADDARRKARAAREAADAQITVDDLLAHIFKPGAAKTGPARERKAAARRELIEDALPAMRTALHAEQASPAERAKAIDRLDRHLLIPKRGNERTFMRAVEDAQSAVLHDTWAPHDIFCPAAATYPTRREVVELVPDPHPNAIHPDGNVYVFRRGRVVCALLDGEDLETDRIKRLLAEYDPTGQMRFTINCTILGPAEEILSAPTFAVRQWARLLKVRAPTRKMLTAVYLSATETDGKVAAVLIAIAFWRKYATTRVSASENTPFWRFVRDAFDPVGVPTKDPSRTIKNALKARRDISGN